MHRRSTTLAIALATSLSLTLTATATAGPPTYSGVIRCDAYGEASRDMSGFREDWTKKMIAAYKRGPAMQDCEKGSVDLSGLTRN